MSCVYFENEHDIGVCNASSDSHIPGIDEMSSHCFKDNYRSCAIFQRSLVGTKANSNYRQIERPA